MQSLVKLLKQVSRINSFKGSAKGSQITPDKGNRAEIREKHRSRARQRNQAEPAGTAETAPAPQHHPALENLLRDTQANTKMNIRASQQRCCDTACAPAGQESCTSFSVHKYQPEERAMLLQRSPVHSLPPLENSTMGREAPNIPLGGLQMTPGTKPSSSTMLVQLRVPVALWMLLPLLLFPPHEAEDTQIKHAGRKDSKSISQSM